MRAPAPNVRAMTASGWWPSSSRRLAATVYHAYPSPAPSASRTPGAETAPAPPPLATRMPTPAVARAVHAAQRASRRAPAVMRERRPVNTGAEPIATTVPTATPVSATAAKKASWYVATPAPPRSTGVGRQPGAGVLRFDISPATRASRVAPTAMRAAPTPRGEMSGPSARAVPVVPNRTAAMSTSWRGSRGLFNNSANYQQARNRASGSRGRRANPSATGRKFDRQEPFRPGGLAHVDRPFHRRPTRRAQAPDRGAG